MDQNTYLGLMALSEGFGNLSNIGAGRPTQPSQVVPMLMKQRQQEAEKARKMEAINALLGQGLGAAPTGGGGPQSGLMLPPGANLPALRALAEYNPDLVMQGLADAQFRQPQATEWERLTQGMSPEEIARARQIRLGLAPDADTALRVGASSAPKPATFRMATPEEAQQYGGPGQIDTATGRFYPLKSGDGMTVFGPDGQPIMTTGNPANVKPFTEGQSKDVVYATRARGALEAFEPYAGALTSIGERAADYDPTGLVRGRVQSDEYQLARQAGEEFLQAILRKDTGAAITSQEQDLYGKTYLPQPGDNALVLEQKARARQRAVAAIEAGMSPTQMLAQERGLRGTAPETAPRPYKDMSDDELKRALGLQ